MLDTLKKYVNDLPEEEAKSLLFLMLLRINMAKGTENYSDEQFFLDMTKIYDDFITYKEKLAKNENEKLYKTVHIVFGDSPAGSLRVVLKEMGLEDEERIITFSDIFSIGPVWCLNEKNGLSHRHKWLKNHIPMDDEIVYTYQHRFEQTVSKVKEISNDIPIIIWTGENAHEQTALRFVLSLLEEKTNDMVIINSTSSYKKHFKAAEDDGYPLHTGEITTEKLMAIYQTDRKEPLMKSERARIVKEWEQLSTRQEVLRIWEDRQIVSVDETYYDDYIIDTARSLHRERGNHDFIKSARLIGEALGHCNQYIGDQFFEYRVRQLILDGIFDIEGVLTAMRYYSVKLR